MPTETQAISVKGQILHVPCLRVDQVCVVARGRVLRVAEIHDEEWLRQETLGDPTRCFAALRKGNLAADVFTFAQRAPDAQPRYPFAYEWDNAAIIRLTSYQEWWDKLSQETRRNVRLAAKRGVTVRVVPFDEALVRGIQAIYNEAPVRLGKPFWHYGKDLEVVRRENSTYLDRSEFLAAFVEEQLVGFIKMVYVDQTASIMQILAMIAHQDKRTTNALLNLAVEVCAAKGVRYLKYCQYVYGVNNDSPLTEFKRRNGFERIDFPRYMVPLTWRGKLAVKLRLQHGVKGCLPPSILQGALRLRAKYYSWHNPPG